MTDVPEDSKGKPSLQPKLWLIGTAAAVGFGIGLVGVLNPSEDSFRPQMGAGFFGVVFVIQAFCAGAALRAGERPEGSVLADLTRDFARNRGLEVEPKPLLWMLAFGLFVLAAMSLTMFVGELIRPGSAPL